MLRLLIWRLLRLLIGRLLRLLIGRLLRLLVGRLLRLLIGLTILRLLSVGLLIRLSVLGLSIRLLSVLLRLLRLLILVIADIHVISYHNDDGSQYTNDIDNARERNHIIVTVDEAESDHQEQDQLGKSKNEIAQREHHSRTAPDGFNEKASSKNESDTNDNIVCHIEPFFQEDVVGRHIRATDQ